MSPLPPLPRVKICGIRRLQDARLAAEAGADAIGLLVGQKHPSGDFIEPETAAAIVALCPPFITPVLVTHVDDPVAVHALARDLGVSTIQIHSDMPPEDVSRLRALGGPGWKLLKALHVISEASLSAGDAYRELVDGFVLDSINTQTGQVGGTGLRTDQELSRRLVAHLAPLPVILAGGLHPDNVADAIAAVSPFGVDVNSGTKGPDGFKDPARIRAFVRAAKGLPL
ncbi:MAG: phosphoribosylanthranilate isomerase [Burkholderiales bacterium]|nr:phosphoribosylanthranilate isomerase [Opitutaceae bacterium]